LQLPLTPVHSSSAWPTPLPKTVTDEAIINKERAEVYSFQRNLDTKFDHLTDTIEKFISSITGKTSSDQADKASSN
jgi:hypothetical protein